MSSITAAPRMIWPSGSRSRPRSESTRAVIPTLVAVRVAPAMIETRSSSPSSTASGEAQRERQGHADDATVIDVAPTFKSWPRSVSSPIANSRITTPSSDSRWIVSIIGIHPVPGPTGPTSTPPISSPRTAG